MFWILVLVFSPTILGINIPFSVPLARETNSSPTVPLSIPASLATNVSKVELFLNDSLCNGQVFVTAQFVSFFKGNGIHNPALSFFQISNRPFWTIGNSPSPSFLCVDNQPIGYFDYYEPPSLSIPSGHPPYPKTFIQIRSFMNPGWTQQMPSVPCRGCDTVRNSFVFKQHVGNAVACSGHREDSNFLTPFSTTKGSPVNIFPFKKTIEHVGGTIGDILHSWTFSTDHIDLDRPDDSQHPILGNPVQWCFYPDENSDTGIYLGDVIFMLSEHDTAGLVIFLLFVGIAFPAICLITTVLYCYKFKKHRKWLLDVRHYVQTIQLESEMIERNFMITHDHE
jgi:hypothetical protein